jgi:hypothetical protein
MEEKEIEDIYIIPNYKGLCWFNAIMMCVIYSNFSRKLLLLESENWNNENSNKFQLIIKKIIINYFKKNKKIRNIHELFSKIKPDTLIYNMIYEKNDEKTSKEIITLVNKYGSVDLSWLDMYIINTYRYLGLKCLDVVYINDKNEYIVNFYNNIKWKLNIGKGKSKPKISSELKLDRIKPLLNNFQSEIDNTTEILQEIPDVLVFYHSNFAPQTTKIFNDYYNQINAKKPLLGEVYKLSKYLAEGLNIGNINSCNDEIEFMGYKYVLDSCLVNDNNDYHSIAGITGEEKRMVYNDWDKINDEKSSNSCVSKYPFPCSLKYYDWDVKIPTKDICINPLNCKIDVIKDINKISDLCFSFSKGERTLIYIRRDKIENIDDKIINEALKKNLEEEDLIEIPLLAKNIEEISKLRINELEKRVNILMKGKKIDTKNRILLEKLLLHHLIKEESKIYKNTKLFVKEQPLIPIQEPEKVIEEPEKVIEEPEKVIEEPEKVIEEPEKVIEEPEKVNEEPQKVNEEPQKVNEEPEKKDEKKIFGLFGGNNSDKILRYNLICLIKKIKPEIVGLTNLNKNKLLEIYNSIKNKNNNSTKKQKKLKKIVKITH